MAGDQPPARDQNVQPPPAQDSTSRDNPLSTTPGTVVPRGTVETGGGSGLRREREGQHEDGRFTDVSDNKEPLIGSLGDNTTAEGGQRKRRKFGWFLGDYIREDDSFNPRGADGSLLDLTTYPKFVDSNGVIHDPTKPMPPELMKPEYFDLLDLLANINGVYDAEENALGHLPRYLYMLIPNTWAVQIRSAKDVGQSCTGVKLETDVLAGVYALAKDQWKSNDEAEKIKWACLRLASFNAGWYDRQPHCIFVTPPKDSIHIMLGDLEARKKHMPQALALCRFIPYLTEFCFRVDGSCFAPTKSVEYLARATKLASSSMMKTDLSYLSPSVLFGEAFRWIGVKRVMNVLTCDPPNTHIPQVFVLKKEARPAGQALITSSVAIIRSLTSAGWWVRIKDAGGYDDTHILAVAEKIRQNPWKYHMLAKCYGVEPLNEAEVQEVALGKEFATKAAPVLQACIETILRDTDLGRVKVIAKAAASSNMVLFHRAKNFFRRVSRRGPRNLREPFATEFDEAV